MPRSGPCPVRNRDFITRIIVFLHLFFTFVFMKIIADSGSTKCTWLLIDGVHTREVRTRGINAVQHSPEQIREALAELPPCGAAEAVYFYGAGCGRTFPDATAKMVRALSERFGAEHVEAESDLLGAARPCSAGAKEWPASSARVPIRAGAAAAKSWKTYRRWATFSATRAAARYWGATSLTVSSRGIFPCGTSFSRAHGLTYEEIIRRVYREPYANRFLASFAPFVHAHLDRPDIRDMVARSFADFAGRNLSRYPAHLPVACVGGVAAAFGDLLRETLMRCGREVVTIVRSPAAGLTEYHYGKQNNRTGFGL